MYGIDTHDEDGGPVYGYEEMEFETIEAARAFLDSFDGSDALDHGVCWIGGYVVDKDGETVDEDGEIVKERTGTRVETMQEFDELVEIMPEFAKLDAIGKGIVLCALLERKKHQKMHKAIGKIFDVQKLESECAICIDTPLIKGSDLAG